jgi:hypothetical protein
MGAVEYANEAMAESRVMICAWNARASHLVYVALGNWRSGSEC